MKQQQVKKTSGKMFHNSLDPVSVFRMAEARSLHSSNHGASFSNAVIIRRAIRFYCDHLRSLTDFTQELIETQRAAKGVI